MTSTADGLDVFLAEHGTALGRLAYHLTGDRDAALDLVQDTLLKLLPSWTRVTAAAHPVAYARKAMVNQHLDSVRRTRPPTVALVEGHVPDRSTAYDDLDQMWRALSEVSQRQRAVLVLRYYEGCSDAEIAGVLGCRRTTVRSLAARGLAALRESPHLTTASAWRLT